MLRIVALNRRIRILLNEDIVMNGGLSFPRIPFFHDLNPTID